MRQRKVGDIRRCLWMKVQKIGSSAEYEGLLLVEWWREDRIFKSAKYVKEDC